MTTNKKRRPGQKRACLFLMAPFFVLLLVVFLIPLITALWLSFFADDHPGSGFGPGSTTFVGLRSYISVLSDETFRNGIIVVVLFCLIYLPLLLVLSLAIALLLDSGVIRNRMPATLALYLPHAVPGIIAALIWLYLYTPGISPVIDLLGKADIHFNLLGVHTVIPAIVNIVLWSNLGYNVVIIYAALQAVSREQIEASIVDGAGPVRVALQIKAPMVRSAMVTVVLFSMIWALQLFTEPFLMSKSTPVVNSRFSPSMYIYDAAFTRNNYGLAAAASMILLILTIALSYGVTRWINRTERGEA